MNDTAYRIPILDHACNAGSHAAIAVNRLDARADETLVRFTDYGIACDDYAGRSSIAGQRIAGATAEVWGRRTVAEKVSRAGARLRAKGVELFVLDAYRPIQCQEGLWRFFCDQAREHMADATEEERKNYVLTLVSDPTRFSPADSTTWPVHACGGAVDVALRSLETGERLLLDWDSPLNETARSDAFERKALAGEIEADYACLVNRRMLHWAMEQEGFINYPAEFWHFDYGDQMYVLNAQKLGLPDAPQAAWYGYVDVPKEEKTQVKSSWETK